MTGNKKEPPKLNSRDDAILRILGETPSFIGVQPAEHETTIEANVLQDVNPIGIEQSNAEPIGKVSEVTKAINSSKGDQLWYLYLTSVEIRIVI